MSGGDDDMQIARGVADEPFHQRVDFGCRAEEMIVVQYQKRGYPQLFSQRVRQRVDHQRPLAARAVAQLAQHSQWRVREAGQTQAARSDKIGEELLRIPIGLVQAVPEDGRLHIHTQACQGRGLAVAGAGLHDRQPVVESLAQPRQ